MKSILNHPKICVSSGKQFKLAGFDTDEKLYFTDEATLKKALKSHKERISELQTKLYAQDKYAVLIVLQAIDAAGKDSCIKHVLTGVNPQGCHVVNFKQPSKEELDHDFLWRTYRQLPERGKIGVFNRSYYEELLVCKVHPEYILNQNIPGVDKKKHLDANFWNDRYEAINEMEKHLVKNGTIILKIFLNLSKDEQKNRFMDRIDDPAKQWKFSFADLAERKLWNQYQSAYQDMIKNTSTKAAPWYVVPADTQWISRAIVGRLLSETLESLNLDYPEISDEQKAELLKARLELENEK